MPNELMLIMLVGLALLALFILGLRDVETYSKRASYAQALFTVSAALIAGYWFFVERKGMPHADVSQELQVVPLGDGLVAVEAHVTIKNLGKRLLRIERINSRLQLIRADAYDYAGLNEESDETYWQATRPGGEDRQFHQAELRWPIFRQYDEQVDHRIEPQETDLIVVTFLTSCSLAPWVRVASDIYNPSAGSAEEAEEKAQGAQESPGYAWKARSFANLGEACSTAEGDTA